MAEIIYYKVIDFQIWTYFIFFEVDNYTSKVELILITAEKLLRWY